jgi:hypothetical protein
VDTFCQSEKGYQKQVWYNATVANAEGNKHPLEEAFLLIYRQQKEWYERTSAGRASEDASTNLTNE